MVSVTIRGRPHIPQQHEDHQHDEDTTEHDRSADAAQGGVDQLGLVVDDPQLHAVAASVAPDVFNSGSTIPAATSTVSAPNCLMTRALTTSPFEPVSDARRTRRVPPHVGDITEQYRHVAADRDDGRRRSSTEVGAADSAVPSTRSQPCATMPPEAFRFDSSTACSTLVETDLARQPSVRDRAEPGTGGDNRRDARRPTPRHREQPVLDLELGQIAERHQIGRTRVSFERELKDLVEATGQTRDAAADRCPAAIARRLATTRSATNCRDR